MASSGSFSRPLLNRWPLRMNRLGSLTPLPTHRRSRLNRLPSLTPPPPRLLLSQDENPQRWSGYDRSWRPSSKRWSSTQKIAGMTSAGLKCRDHLEKHIRKRDRFIGCAENLSLDSKKWVRIGFGITEKGFALADIGPMTSPTFTLRRFPYAAIFQVWKRLSKNFNN